MNDPRVHVGLTPNISFIIFNPVSLQKLHILCLNCLARMVLALVLNVTQNRRYTGFTDAKRTIPRLPSKMLQRRKRGVNPLG